MAGSFRRIGAVLGALITGVRRNFRTVGSFSGNNLFVAALAFLFLGDPGAFAGIATFIAVILFIPMSADPLRVLPRDRMVVWPLSAGERLVVRIVSPWLNPIAWLIAALALWRRVTIGVVALTAGIFAIGFLLPSLPAARKGIWRRIPGFPGRLNQLIRKNLRGMLSTLDFWCAALISAAALGLRAAGRLPAAALLPLTIIVVVAFSTYSQTLFGLDGNGGMTRYRLLPAPGWQILAAKDAAFLLLAVLIALPLAPGAGMAAALVTLALGHHVSVLRRNHQVRWRFSSGISAGTSILHLVIMCAAAAAVQRTPGLLLVCALAWGVSLWRYGRALDELPLF